MLTRYFLILLGMVLLSSRSDVWANVSAPLVTGFNIGWIGNHYSTQWTNAAFSEADILNQLDLAKAANVSVVRIWLFEGPGFNQFNLDANQVPLSLKAEFIPNVLFFLKACQDRGLKAKFNFFDSNTFTASLLTNPAQKNWWWNFFNLEYGVTDWFFQNAVNPLFTAIHEAGFDSQIYEVEFANEINGLLTSKLLASGWETLSALMCKVYPWFKDRGYAFGTSFGYSGADAYILQQNIPAACVNYYDLHVYADNGEIPSCSQFKALAKSGTRLELGEFGQASPTYDDELQSQVLSTFLEKAQACGFSSAFPWRLEEVEAGYDADARFSFVAFNTTRPAYTVFQKFNQSLESNFLHRQKHGDLSLTFPQPSKEKLHF